MRVSFDSDQRLRLLELKRNKRWVVLEFVTMRGLTVHGYIESKLLHLTLEGRCKFIKEK